MKYLTKANKLLLSLFLLILMLPACSNTKVPEGEFSNELNLLWEQVQQSWEVPDIPPAGDAGYVVFFSVSDGTNKASVRSARGKTLEDAWEKAAVKANGVLGHDQSEPAWIKVDIVDSCETVTGEQVVQDLLQSPECSYRKGLSFDKEFETALLEEELNGSLIYNYEYGDVDVDYLNAYYGENGRDPLYEAPSKYITFQCRSWFCDENKNVFELVSRGQNKGQRKIEKVDGELAREMISGSAEFLAKSVQDDGKFVYSYQTWRKAPAFRHGDISHTLFPRIGTTGLH